MDHAFETAHGDLTHALTEGMRQFNEPNARQVCHAAERFVHAISLNAPLWAELERRSGLVARRCAEGTPYQNARSAAQAAIKKRRLPRGPSAWKWRRDFKWLRDFNQGRWLAAQFNAERSRLETFLDVPGKIKLAPAIVQSCQEWLRHCVKIQREAEPLEVDGCLSLHWLYVSAGPDCSNDQESYRIAFLAGGPLANHLEPMQRAADSLVHTEQAGAPAKVVDDVDPPADPPAPLDQEPPEPAANETPTDDDANWSKARRREDWAGYYGYSPTTFDRRRKLDAKEHVRTKKDGKKIRVHVDDLPPGIDL